MQSQKQFITNKLLISLLPFVVISGIILSIYYHFGVTMQLMKFNQRELHQLNIHKQNIAKKIENIAIDLDIFLTHYHYMTEDGAKESEYISEFEHEMVMYCSSKINYEQLRILNVQGMEKMRVNCRNGKPEILSQAQLQDKSNRDYYLNSISLQEGEIYISPLNLNREKGQIEQPIKPIVRLLMPMTDRVGNKGGYLVINYNARYFISDSQGSEGLTNISSQGGYTLLLNSRGITYNTLPENLQTVADNFTSDYGFSFADYAPDVWQTLELNSSGHIETNDGLINYTTYYPQGHATSNQIGIRLNQDIRWKILSFVPTAKIPFGNKQFILKALISIPISLIIYLSVLYFIFKSHWQRKILDDKLDSNRIYLESIMNNMVDGIVSVDIHGKIHNVNSAFFNLSAYQSQHLVGKALNFIFPYMNWKSTTETIEWLDKNINDKQVKRQEIACRNRHGKNIPVEVTITQSKIDKESFYILFIRDLSQQKEQEQELQSLDLKYRHREKIAEVGVLVGGILHEVSNPMAAIEGLLLELKENTLNRGETTISATSQENIDMIMEHVNRLKSISYEVSTFLKPNSNQFDLLDLNSVVNSACSLLRYDKRWRSIELEKHLDKQLPLIQGISDQLTQVLINLLINAADAYASISDRKHKIKISTKRASYELISLTIEDNASGMSEEVSTKVFQQFYSTKGTGKGTGLGLSLCQSIIDEHNGSIELESELGVGTTFRIYLPIDIDFREE